MKRELLAAVDHVPGGASSTMKTWELTAEGAESAEIFFAQFVLSAISACSSVK